MAPSLLWKRQNQAHKQTDNEMTNLCKRWKRNRSWIKTDKGGETGELMEVDVWTFELKR